MLQRQIIIHSSFKLEIIRKILILMRENVLQRIENVHGWLILENPQKMITVKHVKQDFGWIEVIFLA